MFKKPLWIMCHCVFLKYDIPFSISVSIAKVRRITAVKGQTVQFTCPNSGAKRTSMDWKNQEGETLFFKHSSGRGKLLMCTHMCEKMFFIFRPILKNFFPSLHF